MSSKSIPNYYHYMVKRNLTNRLITDPNDTYARKCLYMEFKFPLDKVSSFVDLLTKLKNKIHSPGLKEIIVSNQFELERRNNDPKLPNSSNIDEIRKAVNIDNPYVDVSQEHIVERIYKRSKYVNQSVLVKNGINKDTCIKILDSLTKYQKLINRSEYNCIQYALGSHYRCALNAIKLSKLDISRVKKHLVVQALYNACEEIYCATKRNENYNNLPVVHSENAPNGYRATDIVRREGTTIPDLHRLVKNSNLAPYINDWIIELNKSSKYKKDIDVNAWLGDLYFVYINRLVDQDIIKNMEILWKT